MSTCPELNPEGASAFTGSFEDIDDPHRLARSLIRRRYQTRGIPFLRRWLGSWYRWDGCRYVPVADDELRAEITRHVKYEFDRELQTQLAAQTGRQAKKCPVAEKVTRTLVSNVVQALESLAHLPGMIQQPHWLGRRPSPINPESTLPTENCLLDLAALERGEAQFVEPTPEFFSLRAVGYEFDPNADCPEWIRFLKSIWPTDSASADLLQEFFGYTLLHDTSQHKFLMLVGPPRSGKGTIGRILKELIGPEAVASPTLSGLAGPFALWPLLGKSLAIVGDARLSGRSDAVSVVERLLSIVGEDPQDIDRKFLPPLTAVHMPLRFLLMTNEIPTLSDASGAIVTRAMILRMPRSFVGCEDRGLQARLLKELPGILNWAIAGWQRLRKRGRFLQPESGQELLDDMRRQASPVSEFLDDCCEVGPECSVPVQVLFEAWKQWCEQHGFSRSSTEATFGKHLRAAVPELSDSRPRRDGIRLRVYMGVGLKEESRIPESSAF
ncbi:MAG: NTP-binding protein [Planctomycetaceae bacterium]|nr:NTP-binding protein [Planctomycetaceae bacterium]